ncbi:MAG TPA: VTT domain-containing protein [Longimicrobiaceae bacterium]|nr:VTT domain-containing protein [Longimicrobiaceae bacterium]
MTVGAVFVPEALVATGALFDRHMCATWLITFGVCILSALIPIVNAELVLLGAVALAPRRWAVPLALAATLGQMVGKVMIYYAGRGVLHLPGEWLARAAKKAEGMLTKREGMETTVYFISALTGFPPYYLIAIASGMVEFPLPRFIALGFVGRFIRFTVIALFPGLLQHWLHWHWSLARHWSGPPGM